MSSAAYGGPSNAPTRELSLTERVMQAERGLELLAQYADAIQDHYQARCVSLEAHIHGQPAAPPFPSLREWADQRSKNLSAKVEGPSYGGAELRHNDDLPPIARASRYGG